MEIHVYDTNVTAGDGHTMHFDVITNEKDHDKEIHLGKILGSPNTVSNASLSISRVFS